MNSILTLNSPPNLKLLFNQFNELTTESNKKNPGNFINCRNCGIDEIQKMKIEPTESHADGTLLYINNKLSYKLRQDLCIYKSSELESTFIEIINPKKKTNIIIGCIYRHPTMNLNEFNNNYLNILL